MCDFVDGYYKTKTYLKAYGGMIHLLPDKSLWPCVQADVINPPPSKRGHSRPKLNRRKEADEVPVHKRRYALKYSVYTKFGHNKRVCQVNPINSNKMTKGYQV